MKLAIMDLRREELIVKIARSLLIFVQLIVQQQNKN